MVYLKTKTEIDRIREACRIVGETLRLVGSFVKEGATTAELDKIAEDYIRSCGAEPAFKGYRQSTQLMPFPSTLCTSIDDEVVHGIPGNRRLKNGELLSVDVGVKKNGFFGDGAATFAVGEVSERKRALMRVTEESLYKGIEMIQPDARLHDISSAVQEHVEQNGFNCVRDLVGHGVGRYLHEEPAVPNVGKRGTGMKLKDGMTLAIEPMVNAGTWRVNVKNDGWTVVTGDGEPSAHFEHTVAVIGGKAEILTQ